MFKVLHSSLHRPVLSRSLNNSWRNALKTTWKKQFCLVSVGRKSKRNSLVTSGKQCEIIWQPNCTEAKEQNAFAEISLVLQMFLNMEGLKQVFTSLKNSYYPLTLWDLQGQNVLYSCNEVNFLQSSLSGAVFWIHDCSSADKPNFELSLSSACTASRPSLFLTKIFLTSALLILSPVSL